MRLDWYVIIVLGYITLTHFLGVPYYVDFLVAGILFGSAIIISRKINNREIGRKRAILNMSKTIIDPWCEGCLRPFPCTQTVEECKNTLEVGSSKLLEAMIKCAEKYKEVNEQ